MIATDPLDGVYITLVDPINIHLSEEKSSGKPDKPAEVQSRIKEHIHTS